MSNSESDPSAQAAIATAYHEAGHAVLAFALGRDVHRVSIEPKQRRLGMCQFKKGAARRAHDLLEAEVIILLGGLAAEARQTGTYEWQAAAQDLRGARQLTVSRAGSERQAERLERRMLDKAEHLLSQSGNWEAVELIAEALLKSTTISGREAKHLYDRAQRQASDN